jgi:hypothetical protein
MLGLSRPVTGIALPFFYNEGKVKKNRINGQGQKRKSNKKTPWV